MRESDSHEAGPGQSDLPLRVLLIEDQPDHAELMREALEEAFPGLELRSSPPAPGPGGAPNPDVVLISRSADPGLVLTLLDAWNGTSIPPPVFLLSGPGGPWPEELIQRLGDALVFEKSAGLAFLEELCWAVGQVRQRKSLEKPPFEIPKVSEPSLSCPSPGQPPEGPARWVAGELVGAFQDQVATAARLVQFLRYRMGQDPVARCYLRSLEDELAKTAGISRRLTGVLGGPAAPRGRLKLKAGTLVGLRAAAWRMWLGEKASVVVREEGDSPSLDIDGLVLGGALDDLVLEIGEGLAGRELVVQVGPCWLDEEFCRTRPGSRPGLFARLRVGSPGEKKVVESGLAGEPKPGTVLLQRGLAAAKAHGGYLEWGWDPSTGRLAEILLYLPAALPGPSTTKGASLLIVDDDAGVRAVAEEILRSAGWEATSVPSAERALELLKAGCRFDLILLDMNMEGMDGEEAFPHFLAIDPRTRVVICSGGQVPRELHRLLGEGALGFIPKPYGRGELVSLLGGVLQYQ